jgi:hypothetical protein
MNPTVEEYILHDVCSLKKIGPIAHAVDDKLTSLQQCIGPISKMVTYSHNLLTQQQDITV